VNDKKNEKRKKKRFFRRQSTPRTHGITGDTFASFLKSLMLVVITAIKSQKWSIK